MRLMITKTCYGMVDTAIERKRISKAFRRDPETRKRLTKLMDAIEAGEWRKAERMLTGRWWSGRDKKMECPRIEFVGMLDLQNPAVPGHPAAGFDSWANYADLVAAKMRTQTPGQVVYNICKMYS
jgi:hypothetical protein